MLFLKVKKIEIGVSSTVFVIYAYVSVLNIAIGQWWI